MQSLTFRQRALVGLTLFSMFFGAGNLIFPPFLGMLSGESMISATIGFCLSAVCVPVLAVAAVARTGGLTALANRVHPAFSFIFTLLVYLSIGPCLAIPRTASTSFEMALKPLVDSGVLSGLALGGFSALTVTQALYTVIFFGIAFVIALHPEKLTQRLGKIMSPTLIVLIIVLFVSCLVRPLGDYGMVQAPYHVNAFTQGFIEGYQTMDAIAALNFGLIIALNIRTMGVTNENGVVAETIRAGLIAGVVLTVLYAALAHIGASSSALHVASENGAQTLTAVAQHQFGPLGLVILGAIFVLACMNVCVGLLSCVSNYFKDTFPVFGYRIWLVIFALFSLVVANAGLTLILKFSIPVLVAIYPVAIVLTILGLCQNALVKYPKVYPMTVAFTTVIAVLSAMKTMGWANETIVAIVNAIPLSSLGFEWILPALAGVIFGVCFSHQTPKTVK